MRERKKNWREFQRPMITLLLKTFHSHRKLSWKWPFFFDNSSSTMECNPCYLLNSPPQSFNLLFSLDIATFCLNFEHFALGPVHNELGCNKDPTKTDIFLYIKITACNVKKQLQQASTYNEQFILHLFTRCKRDLVYL